VGAEPKKRFGTFSYGQHLTIRDNLRVRDIIQSAKFQRLFPIKLVEDQNTKTRFNTAEGGWRIASSVDGVGTGEHPTTSSSMTPRPRRKRSRSPSAPRPTTGSTARSRREASRAASR
jgi:hypothetical protein